MKGIRGGNVVKFDISIKPKTAILSIILIIGGVLHILLTMDVGLSGGGIFLALFSIGSFALVFGALRTKPEAWLGSLVIYILLIIMTLAYSAYIHMGFDVFVVIFTFLTKDAFGIKSKKDLLAEKESSLSTIPKMEKKEVEKLSKKIGFNVNTVKCPKCQSDSLVISEDGSGVCQSCKVGIMDIRKTTQA
jgi:hypothetical protein